MAKFRAGKTSRASVGATNLNLAEWSASYSAADLDTTNFEDGGYTTGLIGPYNLDWSLKGSWDAGQNPQDDPPGLYPRDDGSSVGAIDVAPGETVTCTFTNEQLASLILVKNTVGGNGAFDFSFTGTGLPASAQLTCQDQTQSPLVSGCPTLDSPTRNSLKVSIVISKPSAAARSI